MANGNSETARLAAATGNRLRLIQIDLADQPEKLRGDCMAEEVERALAKLVPQERRAFLEELMGRFPAWEYHLEAGVQPAQQAVQPPTDRKELQDPSFLVSKLLELAPSLDDAQRQALIERLREARLVPAGAAGWTASSEETVKQKLQSQQEIDPTRVMEFLAMALTCLCSLDQLIWSTWKEMAPKSVSRRRGAELRRNVGKFLGGDKDVPGVLLNQDMEALRRLIAALVSGISQAGRQFAGKYLARFSPVEIAALANMDSGGFLVGKEVKCWRKYVELTSQLDEASVEGEVKGVVVDYVESLMKGLNH